MQKEELLKLNLEKYEVDIYWSLLLSGKKSVYALAKELNKPRSSMYGYVSTMISKGYLVWSKSAKNVRYCEVVKPENIKKTFEIQKQEINEYENILSNLSMFYENRNRESNTMNIRYYDGVEGLEQIVWNTLSCKSGNIYGLSDWDRNSYLSKAFIDLHQKETLLRGPVDHIITKKSRMSEVAIYLSEYPLEARYLSTDKFYINGDTYIYDNIFAATIFKDGKIHGFEIENEEFAKLQLSTFMLLWDIAEKMDITNIVNH